MRSEELLRYIGSVKEEYIEEIMVETPRSARRAADSRRTIASIAASLAVIILGTAVMANRGAKVDTGSMELSGGTKTVAMAQNSVIMLDVNPSICVEVNDRNVVVAVKGLNEESQTVLEGLEFNGKDYSEAVTDIVTKLQETQYLTELKNSILVSVSAPDENMASEILQTSIEAVENVGKTVDYAFSILSQVITHNADAAASGEKYGVSEGRVDMINKFIAEHSDYSFETLVENNVQLLNQLFEYVGLPEGIERIGDVAGVVPKDCEAKLNLNELSGDELISFTSAISDFYDKLSEYYSTGDIAKRIGYAFNIVESSTEDGHKFWAVLAESLTKNIGNHGAIINIGQSTSDWLSQSEIGKVVKHIYNELAA